MVRKLAVACLALACLGAASWNVARAADVVYAILIDGRPLSEVPNDTGGLMRDGVVFVDAVKVTQAYSGLMTFADAGHTVKISIAKRTGTFSRGRLYAALDAGTIKLSGTPFISNGNFYIPITAFARLARSKVSIDSASRIAKLTTPAAGR